METLFGRSAFKVKTGHYGSYQYVLVPYSRRLHVAEFTESDHYYRGIRDFVRDNGVFDVAPAELLASLETVLRARKDVNVEVKGAKSPNGDGPLLIERLQGTGCITVTAPCGAINNVSLDDARAVRAALKRGVLA